MSARFTIHGLTMFTPPCSRIEEAVDAAIAYAKQFGCKVKFEFNGIRVEVNPNSEREKIINSQMHRQWVKAGSQPA